MLPSRVCDGTSCFTLPSCFPLTPSWADNVKAHFDPSGSPCKVRTTWALVGFAESGELVCPNTRAPLTSPASSPFLAKQLERYSFRSLCTPRRNPAPPSFSIGAEWDNSTDITNGKFGLVSCRVTECILRFPAVVWHCTQPS